MNDTTDSINKLLDIILPPVPPAAIDYSFVFMTVVAIGLISAAFVYGLHRSGFKYKVRIFMLKNKLVSSRLTPKQTAYKLAGILQAAHNVNHLREIHVGQKRWQAFILKLSDYRYGQRQVSLHDALHLLNDARSWTRRQRP